MIQSQLVFIFLLAQVAMSQTQSQVPPTWLTSTYFQAASQNIIQTKTGNTSTPTSTLLFATAFSANPNIGYGIQSYEGNDYLGQEYFEIYRTALTQTYFSVAVQITGVTNLWLMQVRYIAVSKDFPHSLNSFDNVPVNYPNLPLVNISVRAPTPVTYQNIINFTSHAIATGQSFTTFQQPLNRNKITLFMTSLFISGQLQSGSSPFNPVDIQISTQILSSQTYKITITAQVKVIITRLQYSMIIFDEIDILSSQTYQLVYQTIDFPGTGGFLAIPQEFQTNLIIGLVSFITFKTRTTIHFNLIFDNDVNGSYGLYFPLTTPRGDPIYAQNYKFSLFYLKTWFCPPSYVFNISSDLCELVIINNVCGDGIYDALTEGCDDGNLIDGDGCSFQCTVQVNYTCYIDLNISADRSFCYYSGLITLDILFIEKNDRSNQIQIHLAIGPKDAAIWQGVDFAQLVSLSDMTGFDYFQVKTNPDGSVTILANYNTNVQNRNITVVVDPSKSNKDILSQTNQVSRTFQVVPSDNEMAAYYDQSVYTLSSLISVLGYMIAGFSLFIFFLGLIAGKLIGVQMMAVVQISFLSLMTLQHLNPCFKALTTMWFVNGVNYYFFFDKAHIADPFTPVKVKGIYIFSRFWHNFNLTNLLVLVPLIIAFIFLIILKSPLGTSNLKRKDKLIRMTKLATGEYVINGLMFSSYIIFVSLALQMTYGTKDISSSVGTFSLVECLILLMMIGVYFGLKLIKQDWFGEFTDYFIKQIDNQQKDQMQQQKQIQTQEKKQGEEPEKKDDQISTNNLNLFHRLLKLVVEKLPKIWYNILMIQRMVVSLYIVLAMDVYLCQIFSIMVFLILMVVVIFAKPYHEKYQNFRFICNMVITITIQIIYLIYGAALKRNQVQDVAWFYLPLLVCILLIICIIYNLFFILRSLIKCLQQSSIQNSMSRQQYQMSQFIKNNPKEYQALKNSGPLNFSHINQINRPQQFQLENTKSKFMQIKKQLINESPLKLNNYLAQKQGAGLQKIQNKPAALNKIIKQHYKEI